MKLLNVEREFPTPLLAFFRRRLAKFHDAEDLVQDVLLRLAQRDAPDHIRNVKGYVFQVAANRLSDYQKCEASRKQGNLLDISHFLDEARAHEADRPAKLRHL